MNKVFIRNESIRIVFLTLGAFIAGFSLQGFLVPNNMIDGGIVGISIMGSYVTKLNLGLFIFCLNIPFIFLALQKMGRLFVVQTVYAITVLSISVDFFHGMHVTDDLLLATVFGGLILGLGVGLVLRNNAALDGIEILSIRMAKKFGFSIGEIIMFFNVFVYIGAGFLYGWDRAMYSILTYFITYKVIDVVLEGFSESKSVTIISDKAEQIGSSIMKKLDVGVTYILGKGGYTGYDKKIIYCVISRLEISKLKELVISIDNSAFLAVEDVHELEGFRMRDKVQQIRKIKKKKRNVKV